MSTNCELLQEIVRLWAQGNTEDVQSKLKHFCKAFATHLVDNREFDGNFDVMFEKWLMGMKNSKQTENFE
jgi:hypothetical protein